MKASWVNAHYIRQREGTELARPVAPRIAARGGDATAAGLPAIVALLRARAETLEQLADGVLLFRGFFEGPAPELAAQHLTPAALDALAGLPAAPAPLKGPAKPSRGPSGQNHRPKA